MSIRWSEADADVIGGVFTEENERVFEAKLWRHFGPRGEHVVREARRAAEDFAAGRPVDLGNGRFMARDAPAG